jgi:hypothetical protein
MPELGNSRAEPARAEPGRPPPDAASPGGTYRQAESPVGGAGLAPLSPFLRALLRALSAWSA